jgi:DNA-binding SARP family transcriptional activator
MRLLGDFSLPGDGGMVESASTPRLQALIAYLVLHRDAPQSRQRLAFMFWPESSEAQARNNLRQLLYALRHALPDLSSFLLVTNSTVQWRRDVPLWLDVDEFAHALTALDEVERQPDDAALQAAGERILTLYQGDLLPGCYDDWIMPERERLRDQFHQALRRLSHLYEAQRDYDAAIRYARHLTRADALNEEAYRTLMRLLARSGDRAGELLAFQTCASTLRRELGIDPSQATEELHQQLLQLAAAPALAITAPTPPDASSPLTSGAARLPASSPPSLVGPSLVGRQREWEVLRRAWQAANAHGPGFALITGEAGIGKSRLAEELARWVSQQEVTTATAHSYAVEGRLALAPVIEWLRDPALRPHLGRLEAVWLAEVARVLPELVAEHPDLPHYEPMNEYGQRQRFFQALAQAVLAAPQPLLLILDDVQWCDQETLEWLHFLLRRDPRARLLVLATARAEETPPDHPLQSVLRHLRHTVAVTELALQPLDAAETATLAASLLDQELDTPAALLLFAETEGNPLFVVETVHAGIESLLHQRLISEDAAFPYLAPSQPLPAGMRTVIAGRLAQLSAPARDVAALAATLGREFSLDLLTRVSQSDEEHVAGALDELWQRRIVRERSPATYDFTHDKLREVAYSETSAPQRQLWHRRIARTLEALHTDDLDPVSGQIATHYEHGGSLERALPYYHRAALVAQSVFAHEEAIHLLTHCLALLEHKPGGAARDKEELGLLLEMAPLYRIMRGWTAPELEHVVKRTLALADTIGGDAQRAVALYGLASLLVVQAQLERVQLVAEELHAIYERMQSSVPPFSDMMLAGSRLHLGHVGEANAAFERILTTTQDTPATQYLQDAQGWNLAVLTRLWQSHALWCLGYPERAMRSGLEAVQLAGSFDQHFNRALAETYFAMLAQIGADPATARARAEDALALTIEYKAPYYRTWAAILATYAQAREEPDEVHLIALRTAIEDFKATGARLRLPYYLSLLADVYGRAERPEEGLATLDEALRQSDQTNDRWWDAELHRLRGELLRAAGHDTAEVEIALLRAVEIAHGQQSRSLELRALIALARLYAPRPPTAEIRGALAELCAWFTEGHATPDLQAARALLAQWE